LLLSADMTRIAPSPFLRPRRGMNDVRASRLELDKFSFFKKKVCVLGKSFFKIE
jgi:hypothetical protein